MPEPLEDVKTECVTVDLSSDLGESLPHEVYDSDCDNENRSSQKSLPHKKRIPTKLKRGASNATSARSVPAKSHKCTKCGEQFPTQAALNVRSHAFISSSGYRVCFRHDLNTRFLYIYSRSTSSSNIRRRNSFFLANYATRPAPISWNSLSIWKVITNRARMLKMWKPNWVPRASKNSNWLRKSSLR